MNTIWSRYLHGCWHFNRQHIHLASRTFSNALTFTFYLARRTISITLTETTPIEQPDNYKQRWTTTRISSRSTGRTISNTWTDTIRFCQSDRFENYYRYLPNQPLRRFRTTSPCSKSASRTSSATRILSDSSKHTVSRILYDTLGFGKLSLFDSNTFKKRSVLATWIVSDTTNVLGFGQLIDSTNLI